MRTILAAAALCTVAAAAWTASASSAATAGVYVVRADPRACPSPLCGGYWVALANRSRTRCHDGLLRPRCYVAEARGAPVPDGALARGSLESSPYPGFGELGVLRVERAWAPMSSARPSGFFWSLRDTEIRCVRAPCFSFRVTRLNGTYAVRVSDLDLGVPARRVELALRGGNGLPAAGRIVPMPDGGRLFRAMQVYLKAQQPRA